MARNDKRSRLVCAADKLFHEQGINITTLANIAQLADVPLGNVYYYFKSKESIIIAVIEYRKQILQQQFEGLNTIVDAKSRLQAFIKQDVANSEQTSKFGDVLGSLCQELGKQNGAIATAATALMQEIINWCEKQFAALGKGERAKDLALNLIACLQGMSLLTLTLKNPTIITEQTNFLMNWVETA
jgi:AcrR family transcriptional regulator